MAKVKVCCLGVWMLAALLIISGCSAVTDDLAQESRDMAVIEYEGTDELTEQAFAGQEAAVEREKMAVEADKIAEDKADGAGGDSERKIIREQYLQLDVQDLSQTLKQIERLVNRVPGAYIETIEQWTHEAPHRRTEYQAHLVLRLPVDQSASFLQEIESYGNVMYRSVHGQDVTVEYVDNDARLRNLAKHEERLLSLYDQVQTIEDMLKLEAELSRIREQIETIHSRQQYLERVTSTVRVTLDLIQVEEKEYLSFQENKPLWEEAWAGFKQSVNAIGRLAQRGVVLFVTVLPYLFAVALVGIPVYAILYRWRSRKA
ncbi:hypothetical protein CathTA2_1063 [Caldalkalibacillus thermarum TA2.A1]|uniref:DUF4349 domain-containing protein n=2 Tax=Caldalkalibacillus thermarum (strain TA2.A1) TaxID=986075 RepID=F5L5K0_CALTT|nr:DUF4349 domain-containing protein [Caldalkalibacillus thermarum]EGL83398.1 hypothetical protein CathTA2_1063 [Caldalkalibacillus thermarum TA2.A1]